MSSIDGQPLSATHLDELRASAICDARIAARGYQTITNPRSLPPAFTGEQRKLSGLLIPIRNTQGDTVAWQLKPDSPRTFDGKQARYEHAKGGRVCLDVPAAAGPYLRDAGADLWITEGCKKVDSAVSNGIPCTIGVQGVDMWRQDGVALPDWRDIALTGRNVVIAYDSDVMTKPAVRRAIGELSRALEYRGATVRYCLMPDLPGGAKCGLDDAFASGLTRADVEAMVVDDLPNPETDWPEPIPLDEPAGPEPPANALPEIVDPFLDAVATATQTSKGLGTALALAVLSAGAQGRYEVFLPEHGHAEPLVLHTAAVMPPAERKTAVINLLAAPVNAVAQERNRDEAIPVREWQSKLEVLEKRHRAAIDAEAAGPKKGKDGATATDATTLENNRKAAIQELHDHWQAVIYPTTLLADDVTNQRLKELMVQNRGSIGVVSDEGTFLEVLAGRHSDGGAQLETILNGHTGGKVDMQRRSGSPLFWPRGYLTLGLAIQPHVIHAWGATDGVIGKGAAARLMAVFPPSKVGHRNNDAPPVPDSMIREWDRLIRRVLDYEPSRLTDTAGYPLPCRLLLSTDAYRLYKPHWERIERQLRPAGEYGGIAEWAGKLHGATLRIAGLFHLASESEPDVFRISGDSMQRAIELALWLAEHAQIMYRVMASPKGQDAARQVLDAISGLDTPTTRREVHRKLRGRVAFASPDDLSAPLTLLEDYGYIRRDRQTGEKGGRPSEVIYLNPTENMDKTPKTPGQRSDDAGYGRFVHVLPDSPKSPPPDIMPAEPLQPTGTDAGGAFPGEVKM